VEQVFLALELEAVRLLLLLVLQGRVFPLALVGSFLFVLLLVTL